jgi:hypothetical protein
MSSQKEEAHTSLGGVSMVAHRTRLVQLVEHYTRNARICAENRALHMFARYVGSTVDQIVVQLDQADGPSLSQRVALVNVAAPPGHPWTTSTATTLCIAFAPHDATFVQRIPLRPPNVDMVYHSAMLATTFPATTFLDTNQQSALVGSFDILYLAQSASDPSHVSDCQLVLGTTQTQD